MGYIKIQRIPYDEKDVFNLLIKASSGAYSSSAEIYTDFEQLEAFASKLQKFPEKLTDIVTFEYGDVTSDYLCTLRLLAHVIDQTGHSSIHVRMGCFASEQERALAEFEVVSEPAGINDFGRLIHEWLRNSHEELEWSPKA